MTRLCDGYDDGGQSPELRSEKGGNKPKSPLSLAREDMTIVVSRYEFV